MNTKGVQLGYFILHVYSDVLILPRFESCLGGKVYLLVVHKLWSFLFVLLTVLAVQNKINTSATKITYKQWWPAGQDLGILIMSAST